MTLPSRSEIRAEARLLRQRMAQEGKAISHARALEMLAAWYGYRDWNGLSAALDRQVPKAWSPGGRVTGRYLGQPFAATVLDAERQADGWVRLVLDLDRAVDVVRFEAFSNLRKRVSAEVGPNGHSRARTSDGVPHLQLDLYG